MSQKTSQLLDGQLDPGETGPALHAVAADPALRDRATVYGLIGDALRGNSTPDDGYTLRILQRMRDQGVRIEAEYDPLSR